MPVLKLFTEYHLGSILITWIIGNINASMDK